MKPINTMSKAALVSIFAASALIPVASVEASVEQATEIKNVIFDTKDYGLLYLDSETFGYAYFDKKIAEEEDFTYIQADNDEYYLAEDFGFAYFNTKDDKKAFAEIKDKALDLSDVNKGKLNEKGFVVADEQPEDRLNETFFYNFAA